MRNLILIVLCAVMIAGSKENNMAKQKVDAGQSSYGYIAQPKPQPLINNKYNAPTLPTPAWNPQGQPMPTLPAPAFEGVQGGISQGPAPSWLDNINNGLNELGMPTGLSGVGMNVSNPYYTQSQKNVGAKVAQKTVPAPAGNIFQQPAPWIDVRGGPSQYADPSKPRTTPADPSLGQGGSSQSFPNPTWQPPITNQPTVHFDPANIPVGHEGGHYDPATHSYYDQHNNVFLVNADGTMTDITANPNGETPPVYLNQNNFDNGPREHRQYMNSMLPPPVAPPPTGGWGGGGGGYGGGGFGSSYGGYQQPTYAQNAYQDYLKSLGLANWVIG